MDVGSIRITVLVDDRGADGLCAEHGLSLWIEADGRRILFDTGQGRALFRNAPRLGAQLKDADGIVLSHGHYDHTGGVAEVLKIAAAARLVLHPGAVIPRNAVREG